MDIIRLREIIKYAELMEQQRQTEERLRQTIPLPEMPVSVRARLNSEPITERLNTEQSN